MSSKNDPTGYNCYREKFDPEKVDEDVGKLLSPENTSTDQSSSTSTDQNANHSDNGRSGG